MKNPNEYDLSFRNLRSEGDIQPLRENDINLENVPDLNTVYNPNLPKELILNDDISKHNIKDPPLLILDQSNLNFREIRKEDGYLHMMSKSSSQKNRPKITHLFCVTIFSESKAELKTTLDSIYDNINEFIQKKIFSPHQFCVIVMFDGIKSISDDIKTQIFEKIEQENSIPYIHSLEGRSKIFINDMELTKKTENPNMPINSSYLYEWDFGPNQYYEFKNYKSKLNLTMKVFLMVKLKNGSKLSSLVWFLRGFCEHLQPKYFYTIDCGSLLGKNVLWRSFSALEGDSQIGSVCGVVLPKLKAEFSLLDRKIMSDYDPISKFFNFVFDLRSAQIFEYGFSHILDKSFESYFGFVSVMTGCFSAFRWDAIRKTTDGSDIIDNIMQKIILDPIFINSSDYNLRIGNMLLAEDQLLAFEVLTRKKSNFLTKYLPDVFVYTDPIKLLPTLFKQRKRWINGSWFAYGEVYSNYFGKMSKTSHNCLRKMILHIYIIFNYLLRINRYLLLSYIFILLYIMSEEMFSTLYSEMIPMLSVQLVFMIYVMICVLLTFHTSFLFKPHQTPKNFQMVATALAISFHIIFICIFYKLYHIVFISEIGEIKIEELLNTNYVLDWTNKQYIFLFLASNLAYMIFPLILNPSIFFKIILNSLSYIYYYPIFVLSFHINAFSNVGDLSWGTKSKETITYYMNNYEEEKIKFESGFLSKWVLINILLSVFSILANSNPDVRGYYILGLGVYFEFFVLIKLIFALLFKLKYQFFDKICYWCVVMSRTNKYKIAMKEMNKYFEDLNIETQNMSIVQNKFGNKN